MLMQNGSDCSIEPAVHGVWCLNPDWIDPYKKYCAGKCYGISRSMWHS